MALTKVQDGGTNFTGATSAMVTVSRSNSTSTVTSVDFDNLSTNFDTFLVTYSIKTATDGNGLRFRFLDTSGTAISDSSSYQYYHDVDGGATSSNGNTLLHLSGALGNANYEGQKGYFYLVGRNYSANDTDSVPPFIFGGKHGYNQDGNGQAGFSGGGLDASSQQAIRGFSMFDSGGNGLGSHDISVYGLRIPS